MIEKLNNRDAERQAAIRMHLLRVFAFMDAAAGDGLHFPEHELDAGEILSDLMAEVNVEPEDHEDVAQALVDECAPEIPTPAADEVEAVARAIQDAHAPGHPINHVSIYQARAAIAALQARSAEPVGEAKAIIDELNACYLYGVSEKSDALAKRIIAHLSRPAEPAGEEPTCWMIRSRETGIPFWGFVQNHYRSKEEAEKSAQALYDYEPFALYAGPATPTNPERRERGAEPTDAETAAAARRALGTWLSWPDAARDGVPAVDNGKVCSWLQGVPSRLAALSAAPLKEGE